MCIIYPSHCVCVIHMPGAHSQQYPHTKKKAKLNQQLRTGDILPDSPKPFQLHLLALIDSPINLSHIINPTYYHPKLLKPIKVMCRTTHILNTLCNPLIVRPIAFKNNIIFQMTGVESPLPPPTHLPIKHKTEDQTPANT